MFYNTCQALAALYTIVLHFLVTIFISTLKPVILKLFKQDSFTKFNKRRPNNVIVVYAYFIETFN